MIDDEVARAVDDGCVATLVRDEDSIRWRAHARVDKFTAAQEAEAILIAEAQGIPLSQALLENFQPYEVSESVGNLLTRQGLRRLMDRLVGTSSNQALDATHCRIGTGNSNTAATATDTDLNAAAGASNRQFQLVDSAPSVGTGASSGVCTFVATFGTGVGNYAWQEWGIDGGTASGTTVTSEGNTTPGLCNHKVTSLGTKTSAASWVFTVTITIT